MKRAVLKITACLLLTSVVVLSSFAACGKNSEESPTVSTAQANLSPVTIDWLAYQTLGQPDPESPVVKEVEKKFNAKFNFWFIEESKYDELINIRFASGEMPDIFRKRSLDLARLVNQGILKELPLDIIKQKAPTYIKTVEKYDPTGATLKFNTFNGKNYGFCNLNLNSAYPTSLVWRLDWLKNVGINKVPETLAEFEDAVYKFTKNDPDKNGKNDTRGLSNMGIPIVINAFGPTPFGNMKSTPMPLYTETTVIDGKVVYCAIQPEMKEALALLQKWHKDGIIDPEFITGENTGGNWALSQALMNDKIGVTGGVMFYHYNPPLTEIDKGGVCYQEWCKINPNVKFDETYTLGKAPVGPKGKAGTPVWAIYGEAMLTTTNIDKDPRKLDVILGILEADYSDIEFSKLVQFGQKDIDYKVDKDGNISNLISTEQDIRKKGIKVFNYFSPNPDFQKQYNEPMYQFADKYKGTGYPYYFVPSTEAAAKYNANLAKLTMETYVGIISGEKPLSYFDEYVKIFRANGGDEAEKAMTESYKAIEGK